MADGSIPSRTVEQDDAALNPGIADDIPAPAQDPLGQGIAGQIEAENAKKGPAYEPKPDWSKG